MNSELDEEYGAGFEGTNGLLYKYLKDTPGQKIVKHMNTKNTELEEIAPQLDEKIYADDYKVSSEKSQFGGYRPHLINKRTGKTMYLSAASYNTPKEAEKHAKSYLDQYARGVSEPRVPVTGTYTESTTWKFLNIALKALGFEAATGSDLRSFKGIAKDDIYNLYGIRMRAGKWADVWFASLEDLYAIVNDEKVTMFDHMGDAIKAIQKNGIQKKEETQISTPLLRTMKIVSLATGCTDHDALYEYALTAPTYSSIVELKENFNVYIQNK